MSYQLGLWIDHRTAIIVDLQTSGDTVRVIDSGVQKHPERDGDSPLRGSYEARQVPADNARQRMLTGNLNKYYDTVAAALPHGCEVVLYGPGEAKGEFHQRLIKTKPDVKLVSVETADKMTEKQLIAKVRGHFSVLVR